MKRIFISHSHKDSAYIADIKGVRLNDNHSLAFHDRSLEDPVYNAFGHINRRSPEDPASKPVRDEILALLRQSDKLIVLVGNDTHSSLWVQWEIEQFSRIHGERSIMLMRTPDNHRGGAPATVRHLSLESWDIQYLSRWASR